MREEKAESGNALISLHPLSPNTEGRSSSHWRIEWAIKPCCSLSRSRSWWAPHARVATMCQKDDGDLCGGFFSLLPFPCSPLGRLSFLIASFSAPFRHEIIMYVRACGRSRRGALEKGASRKEKMGLKRFLEVGSSHRERGL